MNTRYAPMILALVTLAACGTPEPEPVAFTEAVTDSEEHTLPSEPDADVIAFLEASSEDAVSPEPEQVAVVPEEAETPSIPVHTFALRRGESVHHFARWSEQPIEEVAALSELELDGSYAVGTEVRLQLTPEDRATVEARRDAHHQTRANAYLDSRGPHSTDFYTVKTGDSAWTIAKNADAVPVWLIESLNPSSDLEHLRPGDRLMVPVFQDVTASLDEE